MLLLLLFYSFFFIYLFFRLLVKLEARSHRAKWLLDDYADNGYMMRRFGCVYCTYSSPRCHIVVYFGAIQAARRGVLYRYGPNHSYYLCSFFFAGCESVGACFLICSIPMRNRVRFESCLVDVESHGRGGLMVWPYLARGHTCCVRRRWARCICSLAEQLFFFLVRFRLLVTSPDGRKIMQQQRQVNR